MGGMVCPGKVTVVSQRSVDTPCLMPDTRKNDLSLIVNPWPKSAALSSKIN